MPILIEPGELKKGSRFPSSIDTIKNAGLEALTGADFVISLSPILVSESSLQWHIENRSLFVQRKDAYDALNVDGLRSSIARMTACKIPRTQSILSFIGNDEPITLTDVLTDKLTINGQKAYGETLYKTFQKHLEEWVARGGRVVQLPFPEALPHWIQACLEVMQDDREQIEVYKSELTIFEQDDIWQEVVEIPSDDIRAILCNGFPGIGAKIANQVVEYLSTRELPVCLFYALLVLSQVDAKGKRVHKVPGWGQGSVDKLRLWLFDHGKGNPELFRNYNLLLSDSSNADDPLVFFNEGIEAACRNISRLASEGMGGKQALEETAKNAEKLRSEYYIDF